MIATYLAKNLLGTGFSSFGTSLPLLALRFGADTYWPALAGWIAIGLVGYAWFWRVTVAETLAAMFAAVGGCLIGLLALYIRYHPNDVAIVFHPLEQMFTLAISSEPQLATGSLLNPKRLEFLFEAIAGVVARRTFVLASSPRPTTFSNGSSLRRQSLPSAGANGGWCYRWRSSCSPIGAWTRSAWRAD